MKLLRKAWNFIWYENSLLSWIVNVFLAFVIIKFLVYPGLGLILSTGNPVVAVVSGSMEHSEPFDPWWVSSGSFYEKRNITKNQFAEFPMSGGFSKGDIIILRGRPPGDITVGDIIVFHGGRADPIIHRVISRTVSDDYYSFATKGDNNAGQLDSELTIPEDLIIGTSLYRVPFLGYVKILVVDALSLGRGLS
jgi:signal peptidase I